MKGQFLNSTFTLNGSLQKQPMKRMSSRYSQFGLKNPYTIAVMIMGANYSGINALPIRELPVLDIWDYSGVDVGLIIPKGTIVACVTHYDTVTSGIPVPFASGQINQYIDPSGAVVKTDIDDTFFGYENSTDALLTIANGGEDATYAYSDKDTQTGSNMEGADSFVNKANIPYGIVDQHVFQDDEGKYLNFANRSYISTVVEGRFWIPFVNVDLVTSFGDFDTKAASTSGYGKLYKSYQFAMIKNSTKSGTLLTSDKFGKFVVQSEDLDAAINAQTVGKVQTINCRFPKAQDALVQNFPGIELMGDNTLGVPVDLFIFVYETLKAAGEACTKSDVLAAIQAGKFGMVKVDLKVK